MTAAGLDALHADLARIDQALSLDDIDGAGRILAAYDAQLRRYVEQAGATAPLDGLRGLLQLQNRLSAQMLDRQGVLGETLRRSRRAGAVSRAYAQVGVAL